jgi:hypothetical protein
MYRATLRAKLSSCVLKNGHHTFILKRENSRRKREYNGGIDSIIFLTTQAVLSRNAGQSRYDGSKLPREKHIREPSQTQVFNLTKLLEGAW